MNTFRIPRYLRFIFVFVLFLHSCGLKYEPPVTLEELEIQRREAIENSYAVSFKKAGKRYLPLTYGELTIVKPDSYKALDSVFLRKYALERAGENTSYLNPEIERLQYIAQTDSTPVRYVETHWFELKSDSLSEFLIHRVHLNRQNKILQVEQLDAFTCPPGLSEFARRYMKEDYFVQYAPYTSQTEIDFYTSYKDKAATLTGQEHEDFILHTLRIMQLANEKKSLSADLLLRALTLQLLKAEKPDALSQTYLIDTQRVFTETDGKQEFQFYDVKVLNGTRERTIAEYRFDAYLQKME